MNIFSDKSTYYLVNVYLNLSTMLVVEGLFQKMEVTDRLHILFSFLVEKELLLSSFKNDFV
jgi:hypothetical protein